MLMHYAPRYLFRQVPRDLLQAYFLKHSSLADFPWKDYDGKRVEALHEAWLNIPPVKRAPMEGAFRQVVDLATHAGINAIIDEGPFPTHGVDLAEELGRVEGLYAKAFWTLVHHPDVFRVAGYFIHAEMLNTRCWTTRLDLPRKEPDDSPEGCAALEKELSGYYWKKQGRGEICTVERYRRGKDDFYFFAYPSDYADTSIEYGETGLLDRRSHKPAFEVVYVYNRADGTLEMFARGDKRVKQSLQQCFGRAVLKEEIGPESASRPAYELNPLKARGFRLKIPPEDNVLDQRVRMMRLSLVEGHGRLTYEEDDPEKGPDAIYDLIEKALDQRKLPLSRVNVTKASIRIEFGPPRNKAITFTVGYPRTCSLRDSPDEELVRGYLRNSGIANV